MSLAEASGQAAGRLVSLAPPVLCCVLRQPALVDRTLPRAAAFCF